MLGSALVSVARGAPAARGERDETPWVTIRSAEA